MIYQVKTLEYWAINKDKYIILSILVRKYLQIPATSAPSERFFSLGALIINKLRNRLTKETFEKISLLKSWGFIFNKEEEEEIEGIINSPNNYFIIEQLFIQIYFFIVSYINI